MYLVFRERGRVGERKGRNADEREKHRSVASHMCLNRGLNPQCRHVF